MTESISVATAREADARTINEIGIPSLVLMERAALGSTARLLNGDFDLTKVLIVAGTGNNGGDGLVVARLLHVRGIDVTVMMTGDPKKASPETAQQLKILAYYGITMQPTTTDIADYTTIVDAIFGVGLDRPVAGRYADWINAINASAAKVLAIDVPSGLNADTGQPQGATVKAAVTSTMAYPKIGFNQSTAQPYTGKVVVEDIGVYLANNS
ncbi:NAD(P)H-hydrate epimerase [Secundilactobacillus kimchicus]|nr:NAD(P)H-hydrate epimerase [Secundilactobacillus kimchicus]MBT9672622.1 NAD(P)H-hydrate epimerase [Secundilactobacillus kimchicus]